MKTEFVVEYISEFSTRVSFQSSLISSLIFPPITYSMKNPPCERITRIFSYAVILECYKRRLYHLSRFRYHLCSHILPSEQLHIFCVRVNLLLIYPVIRNDCLNDFQRFTIFIIPSEHYESTTNIVQFNFGVRRKMYN